jgi:hypothetical protein
MDYLNFTNIVPIHRRVWISQSVSFCGLNGGGSILDRGGVFFRRHQVETGSRINPALALRPLSAFMACCFVISVTLPFFP